MAYIGVQPTAGQYRKLDDISSGFNGTTTTFTTSVDGDNVTATAPQQLLVSVGGVIQQPNVDYTTSTNSITFTTAPASGLSFFAILMGDAVNIGTPSDGSVTTAKLNSDLTVDLDSGTAAAPSLTFDSDTGLFSPGADEVAISTGGTQRATVDSSGRLGVGTTSPAHALDVSGGNIRILDNNSALIFRNNYQSITTDAAGNELTYRTYQSHIWKNTTSVGSVTDGQERMRLDSSGRLLVGTSSSAVIGSSVAGKIQIADTNAAIASLGTYSGNANGSVLVLGKSRSGGPGSYAIVQSGDLLGSLRFAGDDGTDYVTQAANIEAYVDGTPGANDMPGRLVFSTTADGASSPTERMRIPQNGFTRFSNSGTYTNINTTAHGFQTNTADWVLDLINSNAIPFGIVVEYTGAAPNGTSSEFFYCSDTGALRAAIRSNGGIANYSGNNVNLCDEREKKNIETLDSTWGCLKNWDLKKFHYNEDADTDDKRYGVIAQQVAPHCPEVITDWVKQKAEDAVLDDDGNVVTPAKEEIVRMGVKEQQMMWMAIKALQEAQTRIETLEAEVAALKGA